MAKYTNGGTYRAGNDNLNDAQFGETHFGHTGTASSSLHSPKSEVRVSTRQRQGVKGGKWKSKPKLERNKPNVE